MADFLSEREWKQVLKRPENKQVKKTGMSDALQGYARAVSSKNTDKQTSALNGIITKAREVKRTKGFSSDFVKYLDSITTEAEKALVKLNGAAGAAAATRPCSRS